MAEMAEMKTLTLPNGVTYEIVDAYARELLEQIIAGGLPEGGVALDEAEGARF